MSPITTARWTLILGLSFVFLYFGVEKFLHPNVWIGWMPKWFDGLFTMNMLWWLKTIGVLEIVIGVGLLIPIRLLQQIASIGASLHLVAILTQIGWNDVAVRDSGLLCMATALFYLL